MLVEFGRWCWVPGHPTYLNYTKQGQWMAMVDYYFFSPSLIFPVYPVFYCFLYPFSGQFDMTSLLLTGPSNLKSIKQSNLRRFEFFDKSDKLFKTTCTRAVKK